MKADELLVAIVALLAFVAMAPAWSHYVSAFSPDAMTDAWLAALVPAGVLALYLTSWVHPNATGIVQGGLMLIGVMVMAPWLWRMSDMAASTFTDNALVVLFFQLTLSVLVIATAAGLGYNKLQQKERSMQLR